MTTGRNVITALIIPLSAASPPDRPQPTPPPGGGGHPPPLSPGRPDHTLPGDLPRPEHPIWYPLPPGAPVDPDYGVPIEHPDQGLPGDQPRPDQGLPKPPARPDQGLPGAQPHPEHPIVLPPDSGGWNPIYIWGGGNVPMPNPPIHIPEPLPPEAERPGIEFKAAWTPTTGWVIVGVPTGTAPAPSKRR